MTDLARLIADLTESARDAIADHEDDCAQNPDERHDLADPECEVNANALLKVCDALTVALSASPDSGMVAVSREDLTEALGWLGYLRNADGNVIAGDDEVADRLRKAPSHD